MDKENSGCILTLAANVNSRSSRRKVLSLMAVSMTSSNSSVLRKRYSVIPSQRRKSCYHHISTLLFRQYLQPNCLVDLPVWSKSYDHKARFPTSTNNPPWPVDSNDCSSPSRWQQVSLPRKIDQADHPARATHAHCCLSCPYFQIRLYVQIRCVGATLLYDLPTST